MSKVILWLSLLCVATLLVLSMIAPNSAAVWWASTSKVFELVRLGMIIGILSLLFTRPPRKHLLRVLVGTGSAFLIVFALRQTYENHMLFLDSLTFLATGVSAGLTALELDPQQGTEAAASVPVAA